MSVSEPTTYTITLHGRVADYTVVPLTDEFAAKYVDDIKTFHDHSLSGTEDPKPEGLMPGGDYPDAQTHGGLYVKKGRITVETQDGQTVFESKIEDIHDELDWDDYIQLDEVSGYGLNQSCAVFSLPTDYEGSASYQIHIDDDFDIGELMLIATQLDDDGWFISKLYYDGTEFDSFGSTGAYEVNKSQIVQFANGAFNKSAAHTVEP